MGQLRQLGDVRTVLTRTDQKSEYSNENGWRERRWKGRERGGMREGETERRRRSNGQITSHAPVLNSRVVVSSAPDRFECGNHARNRAQ